MSELHLSFLIQLLNAINLNTYNCKIILKLKTCLIIITKLMSV